MKSKITRKITIDDLACMVQENFATKEDLARTETNIERYIDEANAKLARMIEKIPTQDQLISYVELNKRLARVERKLGFAR
jgi:hypothetical protein